MEFKDFLKELKKQKVKLSLNEDSEWMCYFNEQKQKPQELQSEINQTDRKTNRMVYVCQTKTLFVRLFNLSR